MTTPIESAEAFEERLGGMYDLVTGRGQREAIAAIRSRDRAIRAEARREALAEAEHICATNRCAGNSDIWPLAVLSCAAQIRALATKEPDDAKL